MIVVDDGGDGDNYDKQGDSNKFSVKYSLWHPNFPYR